MAPVSISALASIATPKAAPDYFANGLGVAGVATGETLAGLVVRKGLARSQVETFASRLREASGVTSLVIATNPRPEEPLIDPQFETRFHRLYFGGEYRARTA